MFRRSVPLWRRLLYAARRPDQATPEPSYARPCMVYAAAKVLRHGGLDPDPNALAAQTVTVRLTGAGGC